MWPVLKRLSLGIVLIALASAVLLLSDAGHRKTGVQSVRRLAILQHSSQPFMDEGIRGMVDGLAATGFIDGKNTSIRRYNAENDLPTANTMAKELAGGQYELVLTASTLSLQAMANANRGGKALHVFALVSDPAGAGVGISREDPLRHPRHLVGYGTMQPVAEAFELAKRLFPGLQVVGEVWNPAEANSEAQTRIARDACKRLGIQLVEVNVDNTSGVFEAASSLVGRGVQAIWIGGDVTVMAALNAVVSAARTGNIPVFTSMPTTTADGTLFALGANYYEVGRLAGTLAGDVLNGRDPAKIRIENVLPTKLVIHQAALADLKDPWQFPGDVVQTAQQSAAEAPAPPPGRLFRIGIVYFAPEPGADICMQGVFDGLRDHGFVQGRNLEVRLAHAQAEIANIPALLQNYDTQGLDLIIPMTTPCLTATCGTVKNTPAVFTYVYDPIAAGAGESFTNHHPNVTGVGSFPPVDETAEMIQQVIPDVKSVGTLYNSSEANSRKVVEVAREAFRKRGIALDEVTVTNANELFQAAQALAARHAQALWITGDNTAIQGFDAIVKVANDAHLPIINNDPEIFGKGALACVGIGFYQPGYAAGRLAARVLLGASPKDLPFENVADKTILLNLNVARTLGIRFPEAILQSADVVVDETGVHERATAGKRVAADHAEAKPAPLAKTWKVDVLQYVNVLDVEEGEKGLRAGLQEAGLVEGRDYRLQVRNAQGDMPTLGALVDAAISEGTDLLMTFSTPTLQAAIQRTRGVPVVFTFVADAIAAGAGRSNEDHLPNVTGVPTTSAYEDLIATVQECLPAARRIGTLFVPAEVNSVYNKDRLTETARRHGIEVVAVAANTSAEMPDAAAALCNHSLDAVVQIAGNLTTAAFASITQAARRVHVPLFGSLSSDVQAGAAVVVARDYFDGGRDAGLMAARIMRGESPGAIPLQPLKKTKTIINLQAARATGLTVPDLLLRRPGVVVARN